VLRYDTIVSEILAGILPQHYTASQTRRTSETFVSYHSTEDLDLSLVLLCKGILIILFLVYLLEAQTQRALGHTQPPIQWV